MAGDTELCECMKTKLKIQEGKSSAVIHSPTHNRKFERREAVAAKNEAEQRLVKETVKVIMKTSPLDR